MALDRLSPSARSTATQLSGEIQVIFDEIEVRLPSGVGGISAKLVFEGNSITAGLGVVAGVEDWPSQAMLGPWFSGRGTKYNKAISGSVTADLIARYPTEIYPLSPAANSGDPAYLFVDAGINDVHAGLSATTIHSNLSSYWATARADGFVVVACTLMRNDADSLALQRTADDLNELIIYSDDKWDYLIRFDEANPDASNMTLFQDDGGGHGLHPRAAGAARMGRFANFAMTRQLPAQTVARQLRLATIKNLGALGIGTDPASGTRLHIKASSSSLMLDSAATGDQVYGQFYNGIGLLYVGLENQVPQVSFTRSIGAAGLVITGANVPLQLGTFGKTDLTIMPSGFVGIGPFSHLRSPEANLHIVGSGNALRLESSVSVDYTYAQFQNGSALGLVGVEGGTAGTMLTGSLAYAMILSSNLAGKALQLGSNGIARMTFKSDGFVGLGNTNPSAHFHITALVSTGQSYIQIDNLNGVFASGIEGGVAGTSFGNSLAYSAFVSSGSSGGALQLATNSLARVTILSTGLMGVGTTAPGELLSLGLAGTTRGILSLAGSTSGKIIVQPAAAAGTWTLTLPTGAGSSGYVLTTDGAGVTSWAASGGGATVALDNLSAVSINTSLLAQTGVDIGSGSNPFRDLYLFGAGTYGSHYWKLTGTPSAGRVLILPDASDTLVGRATIDTLTNKTLTSPAISGGAHTAITSFGIRSTGAAFDLIVASSEVLTASRTLSITLNDAARSLTITGTASISGTNTGDQTSVSGNAGTASALQTARTIGGVNFDGSANITVASATGGFTVSGGSLALGANDLTMTGSLGSTGSRLTKGWFTDLQVTNAIAGSITGNAGSATILATTRAIYGNNFDGSAALTQIIASTYGGTGNGFAKFSGPATSEKTFTLPNASATILTDNAAVTVTQGGTGLATLTSNRHYRGNGTSALAASAIYDDGTNVSIGATSGSFPLTIDSPGGNYFPIALTSGNIGTLGNWVGLKFGFTGTTYQKGAIIFEGQDGNGRGKMYLCMHSGANSSNAAIADARITIDYSGTIRFNSYGAGTLVTDASGNITASSDERLKTIRGLFTHGIDSLRKIKPVLYSWRAGFFTEDTTTIYAGFTTQNVGAAIPEAVFRGQFYENLWDRAILAAVVNGSVQLDDKFERQQRQIISQSLTIESLSARVAELQEAVSSLRNPSARGD